MFLVITFSSTKEISLHFLYVYLHCSQMYFYMGIDSLNETSEICLYNLHGLVEMSSLVLCAKRIPHLAQV